MTDFPPGGGYPPQYPGYPQMTPGYPLPRPRVRPGRVWYLVPLAMFVAGVVLLVFGIVSVFSTINGLQRVALPGGGTVNLTHSGGYTIYYEGPGAQTGNFPPFHVNVAPASPGAAVSNMNRYGSGLTYNIGSHQGRAVLTMNVTGPGRFAVTAVGAPATGADLAFGGSISGGLAGAIIPAIPLMILGVIGAVILLIIRVSRTRALRRGYP